MLNLFCSGNQSSLLQVSTSQVIRAGLSLNQQGQSLSCLVKSEATETQCGQIGFGERRWGKMLLGMGQMVGALSLGTVSAAVLIPLSSSFRKHDQQLNEPVTSRHRCSCPEERQQP